MITRHRTHGWLFAAALLGTATIAGAATYYADWTKPDDSGDGTNWATAKRTIQAAIDAGTGSGDTILVTNGFYGEGGKTYSTYTLTNRVLFTRKLTVQAVSTNPADTVIVGAPSSAPGGLGPGAVRGVQVGNFPGCQLIGFTISNGYTLSTGSDLEERSGGGIKSIADRIAVSNCVIVDCHAAHGGGGAAYVAIVDTTVKQCTSGNIAGGCSSVNGYRSFIHDNACTNSGGGISSGNYYGCTISNNTAGTTGGGGAGNANFFDCTFVDNTANDAGAISFDSSATRCVFRNNTAKQYGGVTYGTATADTFVNCLMIGNHAGKAGGVSVGKLTFINCTMASNTCALSTNTTYGGIGGCRYSLNTPAISITATNCILIGNTDAEGENNYLLPTNLVNCLTYPDPTGAYYDGGGNRTGDPKFVGAGSYRLRAGSPAIDAGVDVSGLTNDLEWTVRPLDGNRNGSGETDIGCYEFMPILSKGTILIVR